MYLSFPQVVAEPYISVQTQMPCMSCHVNPTGGGMRNAYGRLFGSSQLPQSDEAPVNIDLAKISNFITLGGDLRYNFNNQDSGQNNERNSGFEVESGQLYIHIANTENNLSFYLDQQVAPGSALNREAFILKRFDNGDYLKIGKMMPAFGFKLEDDSAFTRQVTGFNFDNSDNGVEYGMQSGNGFYTFFITNGNNAVSNNDDKFLLGARSEFVFENTRLGAALVKNDSDDSDKTMLSLFGGYVWESLTFLAEFVQTNNQSNNVQSPDFDERIALIEANWKISPGHNLKLTEEYYDPDIDLKEDHLVRHSVVYEYTPMANIQLRFGYRSKQTPPQLSTLETDVLFVQSHFYF